MTNFVDEHNSQTRTKLIESVIATVLVVIAEKGKVSLEEIKINGSPITYAGDIGILISIIVVLHEIFELEFNLDLNLVKEKFPTVESLIQYFMIRIIEEKI